jgi:phosphocarrier protein
MTSCTVTVSNPLGLHARAAARFVHAASGFVSRIRVACAGREMDGKSIMGLLLLGASQGTTLTLSAEGMDEQAALDALSRLVRQGFEQVSCA